MHIHVHINSNISVYCTDMYETHTLVNVKIEQATFEISRRTYTLFEIRGVLI